jgi:hypothetical protein
MPPTTRAPFWLQRKLHASTVIFKDNNALWEACAAYFQWVEDHPLYSVEIFKYQGEASQVEVPHLRPMTLNGLCIFLGISPETWRRWRRRDPAFAAMIRHVEAIIFEQKFSGAAANLFNANIIARELGLMDRTAHELAAPRPDADIPTITQNMDTREAAEYYARTLFSEHDPRF